MPHKGVVVFPDAPWQNGGTSTTVRMPALEDVANRPIAHHVLDALLAEGVDEVIVAGTADALIEVRASLNRYRSSELRLAYAVSAPNADPVTTLRAAAPLVGAAPCIVHAGDGLLDARLDVYVGAAAVQSLDLVLLCHGSAFSGPSSNGFAADEPSSATIPGILCEAGVGMFGPGAFREACQASCGGTASGLDVLAQRLSDDGKAVEVCLADGWRHYRGNPRDLLEVNRLALDLITPQRHPTGRQNRIEGRVLIHETATVTTSVIVGPAVVGEGASITNSYIGPYTSIGARAQIEGAEIERSIISPGARVMHVGTRLVSSLVGRGAHVFRDFSLPRAMRLCVGEGDEVALC
jgi:glucose-1-phosphate thymidylyltransferase